MYLLILKTLSAGPLHGYGIAQHIKRLSEEVLRIEEGSLYPALQRMLVKGWVTSEWVQAGPKRRARVYRLTPLGRVGNVVGGRHECLVFFQRAIFQNVAGIGMPVDLL